MIWRMRWCFQWQGKKLNWGKDLLEKSLSVFWTIDSCALTSAASINCKVLFFFFLFLISSTVWMLLRGSYFAVKFCWWILKLLCFKFCVGDISGFLIPVVSPLHSECFKFASHLTKSVFSSFHVIVVSFQMPVALYCVLT